MGLLKWTVLDTPGLDSSLNQILNCNKLGSGIVGIRVGSDGKTVWAIVRRGDRNGVQSGGAQLMLYGSTNGGLSWSDSAYKNLARVQSHVSNGTFIWNIAIAPDNPHIIVVACADISVSPLAQEVWISTDVGGNWKNTGWPPDGVTQGKQLISAITVSPAAEDCRVILVGTRDGTGLGASNLQTSRIPHSGGWNGSDMGGDPSSSRTIVGDILAAKFSPNFAGDSTLVVLYSNTKGTWLATGLYEYKKDSNEIHMQMAEDHVEIKNPEANTGDSPLVHEIITANLELPSDFDGWEPQSRLLFVSTDAIDREPANTPNRGVYRVDDRVVTVLMDNTDKFGDIRSGHLTRRIASIAYFGTTTSGARLLAGEVLGHAREATVQVWHNLMSLASNAADGWMPSWKPPTGALNNLGQSVVLGYGNVQVDWSPDGTKAHCGTSSASLGPWALPEVKGGAVMHGEAWPAGYVNVTPFDESGFSRGRSGGGGWNQLGLINTSIDKFADVAPAPDCAIMFLSSVNRETGFSSVWRTPNFNLKGTALGSTWERVLLRSTTEKPSGVEKAGFSILRLAPDKTDGSIITWAAGGTDDDLINTTAVMWSEDFGEIWYPNIRPTLRVQDMAFEANSILYVLDTNGRVQKLIYARPNWRGAAEVDSCLGSGKSIAALAQGHVLVGPPGGVGKVAYSADGGVTFSQTESRGFDTSGKVHVAFDPKFLDNKTFFAGDEDTAGGIYRWVWGFSTEWVDITSATDAHIGTPPGPVHGIVMATEGTLYASCANGLLRTLTPISGMPIPGIAFDYLPVKAPQESFKPGPPKICGCLTLDTYSTLFVIDDGLYLPDAASGLVWTYTDCLAKKALSLTMKDGITIRCGERNQAIYFTWELLCLATHYQLQISATKDFSLIIFDSGAFVPSSATRPALVYFSRDGFTHPETTRAPRLDCGQEYYWRCKVAPFAGIPRNPWPKPRSFMLVHAGESSGDMAPAREISPDVVSQGHQVNQSAGDESGPLTATVETPDWYTSPLTPHLIRIDPNLEIKRKAAWQTLESNDTDRHSQAANSMRQTYRHLLKVLAPEEKVMACPWYQKPEKGLVHFEQRIRYALFKASNNVSVSKLALVKTYHRAAEALYGKLSGEAKDIKVGTEEELKSYFRMIEELMLQIIIIA